MVSRSTEDVARASRQQHARYHRFCLDRLRCSPAAAVRRYTRRQLAYYHQAFLEETLEAQDRQQLAVTKAVAATVLGAKQSFVSALFEEMEEDTGLEFPYDVKFLSHISLANIQRLAKETGQEIWPPERLQAYYGKEIVAKRAAVTGFLWARFSEEGCTMTLDRLKLWHQIEQIDLSLMPPAWFITQYRGEHVLEGWKMRVGEAMWKKLEQEHRRLFNIVLHTP